MCLMQCNDFKIDSFIMWLMQWNDITSSSNVWANRFLFISKMTTEAELSACTVGVLLGKKRKLS